MARFSFPYRLTFTGNTYIRHTPEESHLQHNLAMIAVLYDLTSSAFPTTMTSFTAPYVTTSLERSAIDALTGVAVLDFGTNWCEYCQRAQPLIEAAFARHAPSNGVPHLKIEDGHGRALGRSFKVKLWPTLIFLRDGAEVARVVRPVDADTLDDAFIAIGQTT